MGVPALDELVLDLQRVIGTMDLPPDSRPLFKQYRASGGRYRADAVAAHGGWMTVCQAAGFARCARALSSQVVGAQTTLEAVIADLRSVAASSQLPRDRRPSIRAYRAAGGRFGSNLIFKVGGWLRICVAAGFPAHAPKPRSSFRPAVARRPPPQPTLEEVLADVRSVAVRAERLTGKRYLSRQRYANYGGRYGARIIAQFGGWTKLAAMADPPATTPAAAPETLHGGDTASTGEVVEQLDDAWSQLAAAIPVRADGVREYRMPAPRAAGVDEIVADIRTVAFAAGLFSPDLLRLEQYREYGGQFSYHDICTFGGWQTLRRAAASRGRAA
jgi:hypothetical protein